MILTVTLSAITVVAMTASIIFKPYVKIGGAKIGLYCLISVTGALLLLLCGCVSVGDAISGITANTAVNPLKLLALFLSMTLISVYLGDAGFFTYIADKLFKTVKGGVVKLFCALYFVVAVLTVFTSNDIIVLTFTPPICIFAKKAKISPVPFLMGEFVAANTWSLALIVGNPTNIYLAGSAEIAFFEYIKVMLLPAVAAGLAAFAALLIIFRKQLKEPITKNEEQSNTPVRVCLPPMLAALITLIACIILLAISSFINVEMWLICVISAAALTLFNLFYGLIAEGSFARTLHGLKKAPYELIPFVLSMFVTVLAVKNCGLTDIISDALITGEKSDGLVFGVISAISANLLNNIPMSVLFEKIIGGKSLYALYGAVIGSNVGAFITPVGALAGIMWTKILSGEGVALSFKQFVKYGVCCAIPALAASCLCLIIL